MSPPACPRGQAHRQARGESLVQTSKSTYASLTPYLMHIPNVPTLCAEAVKTVLDQLGEKDPRARAAKPEQFLEPRFMDELEKEGFIQRLWR